MDTSNLFGQSRCVNQIGAPRRRNDSPSVRRLRDGRTDVSQNGFNFGNRVVDADSTRDVIGGKRDGGGFRDGDVIIAQRVNGSPAELDEQAEAGGCRP